MKAETLKLYRQLKSKYNLKITIRQNLEVTTTSFISRLDRHIEITILEDERRKIKLIFREFLDNKQHYHISFSDIHYRASQTIENMRELTKKGTRHIQDRRDFKDILSKVKDPKTKEILQMRETQALLNILLQEETIGECLIQGVDL